MIFFEDISTGLQAYNVSLDDIEIIRECLAGLPHPKRQTLMHALNGHPEFAGMFAELLRKKRMFAEAPSEKLSDEILRLEQSILEPLLNEI